LILRHASTTARRFDRAVFRETFPREVQKALRDGPVERLEVWPRVPRRPAAGRRPVLVRGGAGRHTGLG
jgi:hypothetical protein